MRTNAIRLKLRQRRALPLSKENGMDTKTKAKLVKYRDRLKKYRSKMKALRDKIKALKAAA